MLRKLLFGKGNKEERELLELGLEFGSQAQAESHYGTYRKKKLKELEEFAKNFEMFEPNYTAKSLIGLETLFHMVYFQKDQRETISKKEFEEWIDYYNAAVFVNYGIAEWSVQGGLFAPDRYVDGLLFSYGSWSNLAFASKVDPKNKKRDSLLKNFLMYVPEEDEDRYT